MAADFFAAVDPANNRNNSARRDVPPSYRAILFYAHLLIRPTNIGTRQNIKVFCLDDNGTTYVLKAGPEFQVVGTNAVEGMCWSSAAVAGGAVFVRTVDQLYCFKDRGGEK